MIDRPSLLNWLNLLRLPDGSFMMHERDGEVDIRGVYCAVSVARLTNVFSHGKPQTFAPKGVGVHSTEAGYLLLTQQPRV